jgi:Pentapeptide repeats (9 copies)
MSTTLQLEEDISTSSVCDCHEWLRSACTSEFYKEHEGKRYCVLHYPGREKIEAFMSAVKGKLDTKDFNFRGVWFPEEVSFADVQFSAGAYFYRATFSAGADFNEATFSADADFYEATFSADANFAYAMFISYVRFARDKDSQGFLEHSYLNLQHARIEKPERVSFHTLRLRPHCFVNVDARKFEFVNVEWSNDLKQEVKSLRKLKISSPHRLLSIAYRQLAVNAEENHRYGDAADFRYCSMDVRRVERSRGLKKKTSLRLYDSLKRNKKKYGRTLRRIRLFASVYGKDPQFLHWLKGFPLLNWLYWMTSGYGERVTRAVVVLAALWLVFACFYTRTGFERKTSLTSNTQITIPAQEDEIGKPLPFKKALIYSFGVMSLQKPEPRPLTNWAHTLVTLETVLGPLQAALLALAIRRQFMR